LYVQGSLDLLLLAADGTLTLCDYKTDRLRTEDFGADIDPASRQEIIQKQLIRDHGDQLAIYADAVRGMFGKYPDRICIYSLPLGCAVDMPVPTEKLN
jgi:ATP-dependent exoDNAse (exonuclease V) beta subunit